ncbi:MAG TPA: DUF4492 domain-containing protein [Epsilonproteobacteria bacterium]|nr:DUF4492 domain-containing protein [Campylobacterota bacterium]
MENPKKTNRLKRPIVTSLLVWVFHLYYDGFKNMHIGKKLWTIILIKLFVMFCIIKWLFFPNMLKENFKTDEARSYYILDQLTKKGE